MRIYVSLVPPLVINQLTELNLANFNCYFGVFGIGIYFLFNVNLDQVQPKTRRSSGSDKLIIFNRQSFLNISQ